MNWKTKRQLGIKIFIISTFAAITILSLSVTSRADIIPTPLFPLVGDPPPFALITGEAYRNGLQVGELKSTTFTDGYTSPFVGMAAIVTPGTTPSVYANAYARAEAPPPNGLTAADSTASALYRWWVWIGDKVPTAPVNTPVLVTVNFYIAPKINKFTPEASRTSFDMEATIDASSLTDPNTNKSVPIYRFENNTGRIIGDGTQGNNILAGTVPYMQWAEFEIFVAMRADAFHPSALNDPTLYEVDCSIEVDPTITIDPSWYSMYPNSKDQIYYSTFPLSSNPVPEPATMLLLGSGLIGLAGYGRKKFFKK